MAEMSPEEMASMQKQAGKDQSGEVTKVAQQVGKGLEWLSQALDQSQGVTDKDKAQMSQIMSLYIDLVETKLGQAGPGEDVEEPQEEMSQVPTQAGRSGVPVGPQTRA